MTGYNDFASLARMSAGLATGHLGWGPDAFWRATPAELVTALEGRLGPIAAGASALISDDLQRLMKECPDGG